MKEWNKIFHTWSLEHVQHSLSDCKSTSDVNGGDKSCQGWQGLDGVGGSVAPTHQQKSSNSCDSRDSICHRHKRWVESWCHTPYSVVTWKQHNTQFYTSVNSQNKQQKINFVFPLFDNWWYSFPNIWLLFYFFLAIIHYHRLLHVPAVLCTL